MRAVCTWGDGPDVLVDLNNTTVVLYEDPWSDPPPRGKWAHGCVSKGSFDLTAEEAKALAAELISAAEQAEHLDKSYTDHCEAQAEADKMVPVKDVVEKGKACSKCAKNDACEDVCKLEGGCLCFEPIVEKKMEWKNIE